MKKRFSYDLDQNYVNFSMITEQHHGFYTDNFPDHQMHKHIYPCGLIDALSSAVTHGNAFKKKKYRT